VEQFVRELKKIIKLLLKKKQKLNLIKLKEKWTMPIRNLSLTISQLAIFFEYRLYKVLDL